MSGQAFGRRGASLASVVNDGLEGGTQVLRRDRGLLGALEEVHDEPLRRRLWEGHATQHTRQIRSAQHAHSGLLFVRASSPLAHTYRGVPTEIRTEFLQSH